MRFSVYIGFDPREGACYAVARSSVRRQMLTPYQVRGVVLEQLQRQGLYTRPIERRDGLLFDPISEHTMSTEFAISRFLVPHLAKGGWALFMDCDQMARVDLSKKLVPLLDDRFAVMCVKHDHQPTATTKMDGQVQSRYSRKNWSSVMAFNCDHPANRALTLELINSVPGRDLHAFCWLDDDLIGELPARFNYLVGYTRLPEGEAPAIVHWTEGAPCMAGYEQAEYAGEFYQELTRWAA